MIRIIFGEKGSGKTKLLVDAANGIMAESKGEVVFIDDNDQLMYSLNHKIRFINIKDYPVQGQAGFLGFISGIVAENYDIDTVIIDGLSYITKQKPNEMKEFFDSIKVLSDAKNVNFVITVTGKSGELPEFFREYRLDVLS